MRKSEVFKNQSDHQLTSEPTTAEFSIFPFFLLKENDRWLIEYFNVSFETFQGNRPEPAEVFEHEAAFLLSILLRQPHVLLSIEEWVQRANSTRQSVGATKSRFKERLSLRSQQLFPRANGHIFVPPHQALNFKQITDARPFSSHGRDFILTKTGQFICLKKENEIGQAIFLGGKSYKLPNAEYLLLPPSLATVLSILIDNFGKFLLYEQIIAEYQRLNGDQAVPELLASDILNIRVIRARLKKILPPQLVIKVSRGRGMGLFSA